MSGREELRALAEAADENGAHWESYPMPEKPHRWHMHGVGIAGDDQMGHRTETMFSDDAAYIAAADPPTVLALLDELDAAEARLARVAALVTIWRDEDGRTPHPVALQCAAILQDALDGTQ